MAVKTSWSSGDVLTAADLTDTFAAKGDVAGETWTGTHDFSGATVTGVGGGLSLVHASSSTATTVSINSVFSSDYTNYRIIIHWAAGSGGSTMRMRASGSDNSSSIYYNARRALNPAGAEGTQANDNATSFVLVESTNRFASISMDLYRPFESDPTQGFYSGTHSTSAAHWAVWSGMLHNTSAAFDGFTILNANSVATTVKVYGYQNS